MLGVEESDTAQERHQIEEDFAQPEFSVGLEGEGSHRAYDALEGIDNYLRHAGMPPPSKDGGYTFAANRRP